MATGSFEYYPDQGYGFPEVQIRMKVDILTDGPSAGLTFHQTVNAPPPEGAYAGEFPPYPQHSNMVASNDISRMLPWNSETDAEEQQVPEQEAQKETESEAKVRYRKTKSKNSHKNKVKLMKDSNRCFIGSSRSLDSKKSQSETDSNQMAEECIGHPKPRGNQSHDSTGMGSTLEEENDDHCTSLELTKPPAAIRPATLPGAVPVFPIGASFVKNQQQPLRQLTKLLPSSQQNENPVFLPTEVAPQDVLINTFEEQATTRTPNHSRQVKEVAKNQLQHTSPENVRPRVIRATEETVTTTHMRYEQVRASVSAKRQTAYPPQPPLFSSKPKMVSAAVQTPKQRVSFDNTPTVPIEETLVGCAEESIVENFDFRSPKEHEIKPQLPAATSIRNPGIETLIDDPGVTTESTQTEIQVEASEKGRNTRHLTPNPNTTETLIDDPGILLDPKGNVQRQEFETLIDDPGLTYAEIQTDTCTDERTSATVYQMDSEGERDYQLNTSAISEDLESPLQNIAYQINSEQYSEAISDSTLPEHKIASVKEADESFRSQSSEELNNYPGYVVQHKLMPSAKIFELYTSRRSPVESGGSRSPGVSPSPLTVSTEGRQSQEDKSEGQNEDAGAEKQSPTPEPSRWLCTIQETKTIENVATEHVLKNSQSTGANSTISSCGRQVSKENTLFKRALIKSNPDVVQETSSIDTERSSVSGAMKTGGVFSFVSRELSSGMGSGGEDSLSDYLQGRLSPLTGKQLGSYAESTTSQDSVISETSLKADRSHKNLEKTLSQDQEKSKLEGSVEVRSFADIMGIKLTPSPSVSFSCLPDKDKKSATAQARKPLCGKDGGSNSSISSYASFRQDSVQEATVMTRPPFQPSASLTGAIYGHAKTGTIQPQTFEKNPSKRSSADAKKVSMSPTSL